MDKAIWKVLAFMLCAVLMFLFPLMTVLDKQDDIAYNIVLAECNRFVDACRDTGYITPEMYSEFTDRIESTGNTYSIKMSHINRSVSPVYKQVSGVLTFTGEYEITHVNYGEYDILGVLYPDNSTLSVHDKSRRYEMGMGDLLFVEVQNKGKTMATAIRDMILFRDTNSPSIFVRSGGMVRNEAY
ncbi:MAG: hypothetical protein ACOYIG_04260 [Acetivibrionales bacterium]|jgi:hypothetical protein|nr:hypothetical protein [Clostridiaceae bacterium]